MDKALAQYERALELSPHKQAIVEEQAVTFLAAERYEDAFERFEYAYELEPNYEMARVNYAVGALYDGNEELFNQLIDLDELKMREGPGEKRSRESLLRALVDGRLALAAAYHFKNYELLNYILTERVRLHPEDVGVRVNLAAAYYEQGDMSKAIETLEQAINDIPTFRSEGRKLIDNIRENTQ